MPTTTTITPTSATMHQAVGVAAPLVKEDSTQSTKSSSYSPLSQNSAPDYSSPAIATTTTAAGGVNAPPLQILSPCSMSTISSSSNNNINSGELWSVARLTALERNAVAVAAEQNIQIHSHQQQQQNSGSHLNGGAAGVYYQGENLIVHKVSSGSSASSPVSVSPPIYGHHHNQMIQGGSSSGALVSAGVSIQKPIAATFYRHELAKQFHLYHNHLQQSHHHHISQGGGDATTNTSSSSSPAHQQSNGVV